MLIDALSALATGRDRDLFAGDLAARRREIDAQVSGRRVLVIGGAGSIGAATVHVLSGYAPEALHVVDQNENALAELVRDLRSRQAGLAVRDFRSLPIDFGAAVMERLLFEQAPYDLVLNFAAVKHVRSEKDSYSLLHMLDTNIAKPARLMRWLEARGGTGTYFCVSTDKAADPVNMMGASKRLMEHLIFSREAAPGLRARVTSSRFANVAFSDGSLLQSFLIRLQKDQPLAVPGDTRRFFISLREAGQICLLAAATAPDRHLLIPRLDPRADQRDLETIAVAVLEHHGLRARRCTDEGEARARVAKDRAQGFYPLLVTPLDTSGEKPFEEFVGDGETAVEVGLQSVAAVPYRPAEPGAVLSFLDALKPILSRPHPQVGKEEIVAMVSKVVPELRHRETGRSLDGRM